MYNIMGTGSRSLVLREDRHEIYAVLEYYLKLKLESHPDLMLVTGMAEGWDEAIAKIGYRNGIPYHVFLPNPTYGGYYWSKPEGKSPKQGSLTGKNRMKTFSQLLNGATEVTVVCSSVYEGGVHANFLRNDAMVDVADYGVVYFPGKKPTSGTLHGVRALKRAHVPYSIYPFDQGELL